ncbi:SIMPL domain-containing protein [Ulvibacter litoralis]|uniref:SIMPL domain-containing protein n=1 Tax=Ulvibacter litoralis TaxID=227084 RepID=A0A1G7HMN4_9FLAO|nr:SIMPL domain-containing protein [Ulvibacter litoralis]GHC58286.1 oxidative stress defense protein [Ulvibacter litoralis]SDF01289.1 hypothetical protein SAMN05421855_104164 [Ulvibacter litoralis]
MKTVNTLLILLFSTMMIAQNTPQPTIDVTGEGIVYVVPDEATINVRVENEGQEPKQLKNENDAIVSEVLSTIKQMGIKDKDMQTEYVQLSKNFDYNTKTYSYKANQSISIKVRDLKKYEPLMNALLESGINRIDNVSFSSSKSEALESQARKKAIENAKMKAEEYVGALNQSIGKAISISEQRSSNGPQPVYRTMAKASSASDGRETIALGEIEIKANVNVSFLLN